MRDGAGPGSALCADKGDGTADRRGIRIDIEARDSFDHTQGMKRRNQVFVHTLAYHLAIERDVVHVTDDDDFRTGIADLGEQSELAEEFAARRPRLHHDEVWCGRLLILLDSGRDAAHMNGQVSLGETAVLARALDGSAGTRLFAEGVDCDARNGLHDGEGAAASISRCRRCCRHGRRLDFHVGFLAGQIAH